MCDITGEQPITSLRLKVLLKVKRLKNDEFKFIYNGEKITCS